MAIQIDTRRRRNSFIVAGVLVAALVALVIVIVLLATHRKPDPFQRWNACVQKSLTNSSIHCGPVPGGS